MVRHVTVITTGGTIEKTYDELTGALENRRSIVHRMLRELRLEETEVTVQELLSKDSLELTVADRDLVRAAVEVAAVADGSRAGIVVLHGTDTLTVTGELLAQTIQPRVAVVLTGAWRPYEMKRSDALQNLTEAIFAAGTLEAGVWCVAHGRALAFPGVVKDRARGTFVKPAPGGDAASGEE